MNRIGQAFGARTVIAEVREKGKQILYRVRCACGGEADVHLSNLKKSGACRRCGLRGVNQTHGHSTHRVYNIWAGMMARCYRKHHHKYPRYGGRGIGVCDRWHDVAMFVSDMGDSYSPGLQIDRIDNDGDYSPGNCRWATVAQQARNKSNTTLVEFQGKLTPLVAVAESLGIHVETLRSRITKSSYTGDIFKPVNRSASL